MCKKWDNWKLGAGTNSSATLRVTIPSFGITKHISRVYYCANTSVQKYCTKNVMQAPAKFSASAVCKEGLTCAKLNAITKPVCKQRWCKNIVQTWCTQFYVKVRKMQNAAAPWQCADMSSFALHLFWC